MVASDPEVKPLSADGCLGVWFRIGEARKLERSVADSVAVIAGDLLFARVQDADPEQPAVVLIRQNAVLHARHLHR